LSLPQIIVDGSAFLAFIPTSGFWLNLVERWFREITDKLICRGTFQNVAALTATFWNYIDAHNQNLHVFIWTAPEGTYFDEN